MKKITLLIILLTVSFGFSQTNPIDFESPAGGSTWNWPTFEADTPPLEILANPVSGGINVGGTVAKFTALQTNVNYAGTVNNTEFATFTLDATNSTVKIMVYKSVISNVGIKFEANFASTGEILKPNTLINQWEEMTFDFSGKIGEPSSTNIDGIVIFPDFNVRSQDNVIYFDNITFSAQLPPAADPTVSAPDPTLDESGVLSVYSDTYSTNVVTNFNFNAFQGGGTISQVDIESDGNMTGKMMNLSFYGAQWDAVNLASGGYNFVHLDYYATTSEAFNFYLIDETAGIPGGNAAEPRYAFSTTGGDETYEQGQWNSVFIPLQFFLDYPSTGFSYDINDIFQWKFDGSGTVYFDNIYFSTTSLSVDDFSSTGFKVYPNPSQNTWTLKSNSLMTSVELFDVLGKQVLSLNPNAPLVNIDGAELTKGLYFAKITSNNNISTVKLIKN